jgi:hypothetical protein
MPLIDVYNERKTREAMDSTFGHLKPKKGRQYKIKIVFAVSEYGLEKMPIKVDSGKLPDSPWLYDDMLELIGTSDRWGNIKEGGTIWEFTGIYKNREFLEKRLRQIPVGE